MTAGIEGATRRLAGLLGAAAELRDEAAFRVAFEDLEEPQALALGGVVEASLRRWAARCGDWDAWAWALNRLPKPGWRRATAEFCARLDAAAAARAATYPADVRHRELLAATFRLLRAGTPGRVIVDRVHRLARVRPDPLPPERVDALLSWAARRHREARHGA